jgi:Skp family chaperone for outer membrane proteins
MFTIAGHAQAQKTPSAIAYVSNTRIFRESVHGRSESARIQQFQQQRTVDLRTKQQALEATRREIATTTDNAKRSTLEQQEIAQRTELETASAQMQIDLQNLQREINADMSARVKTILDEMMKTQSYQLVLNSDSSLVWLSPELDLTAAVIARMNGQ